MKVCSDDFAKDSQNVVSGWHNLMSQPLLNIIQKNFFVM